RGRGCTQIALVRRSTGSNRVQSGAVGGSPGTLRNCGWCSGVQSDTAGCLAGGPGFEPGLSDPKSDGLPLADPPAGYLGSIPRFDRPHRHRTARTRWGQPPLAVGSILVWSPRGGQRYASAIASISTAASRGSLAACTVARAGGFSLTYSP